MNKGQTRKRRKGVSKRGNNHKFVILRFLLIVLLLGLVVGGILWKLVDTTIVHAEDYEKKGQQLLGKSKEIPPLRGEILSSDGSILATNLNYFDVGIDFRASRFDIVGYADSISILADSLAKYYPTRTKAQWAAHLSKPFSKPRKERPRSFWLLRAVSQADVDRIKTFPFFRKTSNTNYTGLKTQPVLVREYPYGKMAALSIGRVAEVDSQQHGISGLEMALDSLLFGVPGKKSMRLFTRGGSYWEEVPPVNGYTVLSTIDITIQDILEYELGKVVLESGAEWGAAIIMDVETGDIKAISNLEPDTLSPTPRCIEAMNRVVMGFEPGSVVKVVTMAAALEKGFAYPLDRTFNIGHVLPWPGFNRGIQDTHSPATLPVQQFLRYSSNIGMTKLAYEHYADDYNGLRNDIESLGFFERFNTGIALERAPYYPRLKQNRGAKTTFAGMTFGYNTLVPPLYTCAFYNAVANDGKFVRPRIVRGLRLADGRDSMIPVSYVRKQMISSKNAAVLRDMLHEVVWEIGGTARLARDKDVEIAGKTGTAKVAKERPVDKDGKPIKSIPFTPGYHEKKKRFAFCGFFPYSKPRYTMMVLISGAKHKPSEAPEMYVLGPNTTSVLVLKNVAKKLYSRGYLGTDKTIDEFAGEVKAPDTTPVVYASFNGRRNQTLLNDLRFKKLKTIEHPDFSAAEGTVPDVRGVGLREALTILEKSGYEVKFSGIGFVESQSPASGTAAPAGSKVHLTLRQNE